MGKLFSKREEEGEEKEPEKTEEPKNIEERIELLMEQKKEAIRETIINNINEQLEGEFKNEIDELKTLVTWTEPVTGEDLLRVVEKGGKIIRGEILRAETEYDKPSIGRIIEKFIEKQRYYWRDGVIATANKYRVTIIVEPL